MQNPFFHRGPIRQRDYFFNRQREVSQALGLLRNLQEMGPEGDRYEFTVDLMRLWIEEVKSLSRVIEEII